MYLSRVETPRQLPSLPSAASEITALPFLMFLLFHHRIARTD
jgi:hypothetical protein